MVSMEHIQIFICFVALNYSCSIQTYQILKRLDEKASSSGACRFHSNLSHVNMIYNQVNSLQVNHVISGSPLLWFTMVGQVSLLKNSFYFNDMANWECTFLEKFKMVAVVKE